MATTAAPPNLSGDALIFQGDLYDEETYQVSITPTSYNQISNNPKGIFNIACIGSAISKLHLLRHTSASQGENISSNLQPDELQRQALLRLLTGDYCGTGNLFIQNGIPIHLEFNNSPYQPTTDSKFEIDNHSDSIDARWDHTGATCIGIPRLGVGVLDQIKSTCKAVGHALPDCARSAASSDAVSANPSIILTPATE
jgi:hypothetical protein